MAESDFIFKSDWDIDQQTRTATTVPFTFAVGNSGLYTIPTNLQVGGFPVFDAVFKTVGGSWLQFGKDHLIFCTPTSLVIYSPYTGASNMVVRYHLYADKIDY